MKLTEAIIVNWRDSKTYVGHDNAIVWPILSVGEGENRNLSCCLQYIGGFARHSMQGRKNSDHHSHANAEQFYYILSGGGEVLIYGGDEGAAMDREIEAMRRGYDGLFADVPAVPLKYALTAAQPKARRWVKARQKRLERWK